jgi:rhodanese-related sulfurtransferase
MSIQTISPKQLQDRILAGDKADLIDVRTPAEFREVHVTIAKNAPLESLDCGALLAAHPTNAPLYVICRSGSRGKQACEKIQAAGCTNVVNVEGGTMAWDQAGYPVVRGKKADLTGTSGSHLCGLHGLTWAECSQSPSILTGPGFPPSSEPA